MRRNWALNRLRPWWLLAFYLVCLLCLGLPSASAYDEEDYFRDMAELETPLSPETLAKAETWLEANKASYMAAQNQEFVEAADLSALALYHFRRSEDVQRHDVHLTLVNNSSSLYLEAKDKYSAERILFEGINSLWENGAADNQSIVSLALVFGTLAEGNEFAVPRSLEKKQLQFFWDHIIQIAQVEYGEASFGALTAEYFAISHRQAWQESKWIKKPLLTLIDKSMDAQTIEPALMALSMWTAIRMNGDNHAVALKKIKEVAEQIGEADFPDVYKHRLFSTVARYYFPKYGPEKTEAILSEVPLLEPMQRQPGDPDDVGLWPSLRRGPIFRNIRKLEYITLEFSVDRFGHTNEISILEASNDRLIKPALKAIEKWEYVPAFRDGKFIESDSVRVRFTVHPPQFRY